MFQLEASLFVNYDENLARFIEKICSMHRVYAVGRKLVVHPKFVPSEEFLNRIVKDDVGVLLFGEPQICPPYDKDVILERYAEIKANQPIK